MTMTPSADRGDERPKSKWLSTRNAAIRIGYSPRTLERWRWLGVGAPYSRRGGRCRYDIELLDEWMRAGGDAQASEEHPAA